MSSTKFFEKSVKYNITQCTAFVDYEKVFDSTETLVFIQALRKHAGRGLIVLKSARKSI